MEVILVLQQTGRCVSDTAQSSAVGQYLAQYASLLATQGALSTAYHYLASNNNLQVPTGTFFDRFHVVNYFQKNPANTVRILVHIKLPISYAFSPN